MDPCVSPWEGVVWNAGDGWGADVVLQTRFWEDATGQNLVTWHEGFWHPWYPTVSQIAAIGGQWHHFAFVRAGDNVKQYMDGLLLSSEFGCASDFTHCPAFFVAGPPHGPSIKDESKMDEFRIYDYALSQAEIASIAGATNVP